MKRRLVLKRESLIELSTSDLHGVVGAGAIPTLDADCEATRTCLSGCIPLTCATCDGR